MMLDNWSPRERPVPDILSSQYARLERLDWDRHGDRLFEAIGGEVNNDLWTYMPIGPFPERGAFEQGFEGVRARLGWETSVICDAATGSVLGMASYMRIRPEHGSVEVGCVTFGPALKRTRQATDAMFLMAQYVFDNLGYRRYEWKCDNTNAASKRAAERFGFQFEGIFRNDMVCKGRNRDTAWYSITDAEWPHVKAGFEAWLDPANFDEAGGQLSRLEQLRS